MVVQSTLDIKKHAYSESRFYNERLSSVPH